MKVDGFGVPAWSNLVERLRRLSTGRAKKLSAAHFGQPAQQ
jgi:hypothetical protein